jgi:hypothetical protein
MPRYFGRLSDAQYHRSLVEARARADPQPERIQTMATPTTQPADRISATELRALLTALDKRETETRATVETLAAIVDALTQETRELREAMAGQLSALAVQLAAQPAPAATPTGPATGFVDFTAETISAGIDDTGKTSYKAKGGQYQKYGVRIWPETLALLGLSADALTPGQPHPFGRSVRAELGEGGLPRKVIGLTPSQQPPAAPQPPATPGKTTPAAESSSAPILPTRKPASRPRQELEDF